jgi:diacylglycerol kinase family enzyme
MRIQLIHNPASGTHDPQRVEALAAAFRAAGATVLPGLSSPQHACRVDARAHRIVVVGGDGTVRHVAASIRASGRELPLAVYPGGTVNLLHRELGSPTEPAAFARMVMAADAPSPAFAAHGTHGDCLVCASIGPDSHAVAALSEPLQRALGRLAYVMAFLGVLWRWPRPRLQLCVDGEQWAAEAVFIAKGRFYAGPWSFAPEARVEAPVLHVVALPRLTRWVFLRFALALLRGLPPPAALCRTAMCREICIDAAPGSPAPPLQADGDLLGTTPARFTVGMQPYGVCRSDPG